MGYFAVAGVLGVAKGKNLSILFCDDSRSEPDMMPRREEDALFHPRLIDPFASPVRSFPFFLPSFPPSWRDNGNWQKIDSTWLHFGGRITPVNASLILIYLFRSRLCRVFPFSRRDLEEKEGINALPPLWSKKKKITKRTKRNTPSFFFFFLPISTFGKSIWERDLRKRKVKVGAAVKSLVVTRLDDEGKKKKKKKKRIASPNKSKLIGNFVD